MEFTKTFKSLEEFKEYYNEGYQLRIQSVPNGQNRHSRPEVLSKEESE